ncbi:MAG: sigma-54 dependent transcriptional regulator [Bdellovibrionota bacterium]
MKILIADDETAIRQSIKLILSDLSYELIETGDLETAYRRVTEQEPDLLLLDVHFKNATSLDLMRRLVTEGVNIPIIVLSGAASASEAAEAIKLGAYDFIEKPISSDRLRISIQHCLESAVLKQKVQRITIPSGVATEIIGKSSASQKIRKFVEKYAKRNVKILITGETGVGKEVVAQSVWQASDRSEKPFIVVNSAAIPENLIESELFGHRKGSFTGAVSDQVGKIEMSDRGTLFLDEVGDLSAGAQTKLLRFLESGEIQKVGSNQVKKVDVRLIAATSRDLEKEMEKGHFRPDLYYRLNVARITIPPLRERPEDIAPLFSFFIDNFCRKFKETSKTISHEVIEALTVHAWQGNVRELRNVAERIVLIADHRILKEHLDQVLNIQLQTRSKEKKSLDQNEVLPLKEFKNKVEREYIESVLTACDGSVTRAAQLLHIDRTYLHQKMTNHGICGKGVKRD